MMINAEARDDIELWLNSTDSAYNVITHRGPELTLTTTSYPGLMGLSRRLMKSFSFTRLL